VFCGVICCVLISAVILGFKDMKLLLCVFFFFLSLFGGFWVCVCFFVFFIVVRFYVFTEMTETRVVPV
jgi:hypothetical protein